LGEGGGAFFDEEICLEANALNIATSWPGANTTSRQTAMRYGAFVDNAGNEAESGLARNY